MARANRHYIPGYVWHITHNEIQDPPRRYRIIDLKSLIRLVGCQDLQDLQSAHERWIEASLRINISLEKISPLLATLLCRDLSLLKDQIRVRPIPLFGGKFLKRLIFISKLAV